MASSSSQSCNFDVFLSFRGEDTRETFVDHLYSALVDRKIHTYKDDETLPRGEFIRQSLLKAIEGSRIAVVIFSKNYADSSWCLDELAYIMKCNDERELTVMPVFYDVVPSEVRKQEGDFGKGFSKQDVKNINKVEVWRKALIDASDIAGWEHNRREWKVIKDIVNAITDKLYHVNSSIDEDLVGMSAPLQELEEQLELDSPGVRMVGIWGVGGGGKTTLASSLYMKICCHFQGHCIIDNIREASKNGLSTLQEKLLNTLLKTEIKLQSIEEGKNMIRSRLNRSNVLIILDDVDDLRQLDALVGSHNWFGSGSRIIITTRNEHLLVTHKVHVVFQIKLLSHEDATQLFNKRAYNGKMHIKDYDALSLEVVSYASRLPLALKVLGSFLYDKDEKEWRSTIDKLYDTPQTEILEHLKISYDGLESNEKEIFLDIACFFRFSKVDYAMERLEACGYHPHIGIRVLRQKALITIVKDVQNCDKFDMHDLIQEMGQHIVRGEHSRLWKNEENTNMCLSDATNVNDKIKAVICKDLDDDHISALYKNVSNMKQLRLLQMNARGENELGYRRTKEGVFLSNELLYIDLIHYPRSMFPNTFNPVKLVVLKLHQSSQKHLWKGCKHLPHLKVLQLDDMKNLLDTPDFNGLPSLQKLAVSHCGSLKTIHPSLGEHTSVENVSVWYCEKLRMFPTIIHMRKLKTLQIKSRHKMLEFPEIKSNMDSLEELSLNKIRIDALLPSIGERCANLISLQLYGCFYSTSIEFNFDGLKYLDEFLIYGLGYDEYSVTYLICNDLCGIGRVRRDTRRLSFVSSQLLRGNLRKLRLRNMGLKDGEIPSGIGEMSNLEELDLSYNLDITQLGFTLSQLTRLKSLDISFTELVELPKLPSGLIILEADWCRELTITGDSFMNCKQLCNVSLIRVRAMNYYSRLLESMLQGDAIESHCMRLRVDGIEIAKEFNPPLLIKGDRCRLKLSENWRNDFSGFLMCVVDDYFSDDCVSMKKVTSGMEFEDEADHWEETDHSRNVTLVWYVPFALIRHSTWWNSIDKAATSISFQFEKFGDDICRGFGVKMVERKSRSGATETSTTQQQEESDLLQYTPKMEIHEDSQHLLKIRNHRNFGPEKERQESQDVSQKIKLESDLPVAVAKLLESLEAMYGTPNQQSGAC